MSVISSNGLAEPLPATVTERTPETPGLASLPAAVKPTAIAWHVQLQICHPF